MKTLNEVVVEKLCSYLREKNLTQYKLAQKSGLSYATIKSII